MRDQNKRVFRAKTAGRELLGHSFGCIVASAMLAGPGGRGSLIRPIDSLALVQGALSLWSYCGEIPTVPDRAGYFHEVLAGGCVRGPIVTTQSEYDAAVGRWYPLAAGVAGQVAFGPGGLPRYGAVGAFGLRGHDAIAHDAEIGPVDADYDFEPGRIYNLEGRSTTWRAAESFAKVRGSLQGHTATSRGPKWHTPSGRLRGGEPASPSTRSVDLSPLAGLSPDQTG